MDLLPAPLLGRILADVPTLECIRLRRVCRSWRKAVDSWIEEGIKRFVGTADSSPAAIVQAVMQFSSITEIELRCVNLLSEVLTYVEDEARADSLQPVEEGDEEEEEGVSGDEDDVEQGALIQVLCDLLDERGEPFALSFVYCWAAPEALREVAPSTFVSARALEYVADAKHLSRLEFIGADLRSARAELLGVLALPSLQRLLLADCELPSLSPGAVLSSRATPLGLEVDRISDAADLERFARELLARGVDMDVTPCREALAALLVELCGGELVSEQSAGGGGDESEEAACGEDVEGHGARRSADESPRAHLARLNQVLPRGVMGTAAQKAAEHRVWPLLCALWDLGAAPRKLEIAWILAAVEAGRPAGGYRLPEHGEGRGQHEEEGEEEEEEEEDGYKSDFASEDEEAEEEEEEEEDPDGIEGERQRREARKAGGQAGRRGRGRVPLPPAVELEGLQRVAAGLVELLLHEGAACKAVHPRNAVRELLRACPEADEPFLVALLRRLAARGALVEMNWESRPHVLLCVAVARGLLGVARELVDGGLAPLSEISFCPPLLAAVDRDRDFALLERSRFPGREAAAVEFLLSRGADPNVEAHPGENALNACAEHGLPEAAALLVRAGARILGDSQTGSAMAAACLSEERFGVALELAPLYRSELADPDLDQRARHYALWHGGVAGPSRAKLEADLAAALFCACAAQAAAEATAGAAVCPAPMAAPPPLFEAVVRALLALNADPAAEGAPALFTAAFSSLVRYAPFPPCAAGVAFGRLCRHQRAGCAPASCAWAAVFGAMRPKIPDLRPYVAPAPLEAEAEEWREGRGAALGEYAAALSRALGDALPTPLS
eukprot:tig00020614_g12117.t1